ncbi:MAG: hypothetical protein JNM41_13495 [Flavipsychrobacter sp.]|nr:hypothetical protein [Flavipsychrobacter sp.]
MSQSLNWNSICYTSLKKRMRNIKLTFVNSTYLDTLMNDSRFQRWIAYLNPKRLSETSIALYDSVETHSQLDTEVVVLTEFAGAVKRLIFPDTQHQIEFLNPFATQLKGGLHHNGERIISSTDVSL